MTSIEWLIKELYTEMNLSGDGRVLDEILEEAKEMHKQEIIDARDDMQKYCIKLANRINPHLFEFDKKDAEQYYKETFVSNGSDEVELPKHPSVISENGNELLFDKEGNLIKELPQEETLYTEEQMIGFAEWILNQDMKMVLIYTKKSLLKEYIESLKQTKQ